MRIGFIAAILFCCSYAVAQQNTIQDIVSNHTGKQPVYKIAHSLTEQYVTIACEFGKAELAIPENMADLTTVQVTAIDLVFTDFPTTDDLIKLNTSRLQHLFTKFPFLVSTSIAWNVIRQTDGAEKNTAIHLFHGFVIYYRPLQNAATAKTDLLKLKDMLAPKDEPVKIRNGFVIGDTSQLRKQYEIEEYTTVLKLPVEEALRYMQIDLKEKATYKNYDSLFVYIKPSADTVEKTSLKPPPDSTVIKIFDRMHWKRMLVVADVTASMYPYTGQLLIWLKLHEEERPINEFVFFNDGDDMEDDKKVMGNTGGIYSTSSSVFEVVEQLLFKAMSNGNGGAIPENNMEALIKGAATCNDCGDITMIADNNSGVSDVALLKQFNRPVHVILCGVHDLINLDYLNIALYTGGSVHTEDEDLNMNLKEDEQVNFHHHQYKVKNRKIVLMKN